jgi:hypothetical protein
MTFRQIISLILDFYCGELLMLIEIVDVYIP